MIKNMRMSGCHLARMPARSRVGGSMEGDERCVGLAGLNPPFPRDQNIAAGRMGHDSK
jgi:hypothetical protein